MSSASTDVAVQQTTPAVALSATRRPERFYHPELDGLRFAAFLGIFFYHLFPIHPESVGNSLTQQIILVLCSLIQAGAASVDLFFALSSYLITHLLLREQQATGQVDIRSFYVRRILRVWPLYYAMLLFALFAEPLLIGGGMPREYGLAYALFVGNWVACWIGGHPETAAMVLWTVSIEEQFYIVWPWLVRWCTPRRMVVLSVALLVVASATRIALALAGAPVSWIDFSTVTRMDGIAAGALLAIWMGSRSADLSQSARRMIYLATIVVVVAVNRLLILRLSPAAATCILYPLWTAAGTLIVWATLQPVGQAKGILTWRFMVYLGRISYGLYVMHYLCIALVMVWVVPRVSSGSVRLLALPLTILLATLSYYLLERPFLHLKLRFTHVASRPGG